MVLLFIIEDYMWLKGLYQLSGKVSDEIALVKTNKKSTLKIFWNQRVLFLFLLPSIVLALVFNYAPMVGLVMAFQNYKVQHGFFGSEFVGFVHFSKFFKDPEFYRALKNTICISLLKIIFEFPAPIILAILLDEIKNIKFKRVCQTITYLPHFVSWIIVATMVYRMVDPYSGIVNIIIKALGGQPIEFMRESKYFWGILIGTGIWKEIGWNSIIYLAAISAINPELYSAAMVDGANRFQRIIHVTLPGIMPTVALMFVLGLGGLVHTNFDAVFNLMNPLVQTRAEVIDTYVFRTGIQLARYSYATAIGLTQSIISTILVFIGFRLANKINQYTIV